MDQPPGRVDNVPSAITGLPLRYFTPDPLTVLLDRCRPTAGAVPVVQDPRLEDAGLLLIASSSRRGPSGGVDFAQAMRFAEILTGLKQLDTLDEIVNAGRTLSTRVTGLRDEIVFSGGPTASDAHLVYALPASLRQLLVSLEAGLAGLNESPLDPAIVVGVTGFFCIHLHPFVDANGRWSRLVMASVGARRKAGWPAMVQTSLQNACKREFGERIWPEARANGLKNYLLLVHRFEQELTGRLHGSEILHALSTITGEINRQARTRSARQTTIAELFSKNSVSVHKLREKFGSSAKSMAGFLDRVTSYSTIVRVEKDMLSIQGLIDASEAEFGACVEKIVRG
ncbi:Fic family protein [Luteimonas gilva]|nr:Fic family protein [Luteimonas gilva]